METYIQLKHFMPKPNAEHEEKTPCQQCLEDQKITNEQLWLNIDNCEDLCSEEPDGFKAVEKALGNYYQKSFALKVSSIKCFYESPEGRLIVEHGENEIGQLFADKYDDFVEKIKEHANIIK